jgi:hypothetical protein
MKRGWKGSTAEGGDAASRLNEVKLGGKANPIPHAEAAVEIEQVDTTAQQNVLAVIDYLRIRLGGRYGIGGRTATQKSAGFVEVDLKALSRQRRRGRESR